MCGTNDSIKHFTMLHCTNARAKIIKFQANVCLGENPIFFFRLPNAQNRALRPKAYTFVAHIHLFQFIRNPHIFYSSK